jgi:hypothetical protein
LNIGVVPQALTFWWEAKDLFLFIFSDGSLIPHLRRSTQSEIQKLKDILDRIVRFLWKCEESVRNSHLILLEIHNIFGIELLRACRRDAQRSRTVAQRLIGVFKSLIKKSKVNAQNPLPMEKSDASNVGGEKNAVTQKRSFFYHLCGCGGAKQNKDVVDPKRPSATSKLIRASKQQDLDPIKKYTHECFTREVRQLIEELTRISKQPDSIFLWTLNDETVLEKIMDFGWSNLIDYSLPCSSMKEPFISAQDYIESKSQQISISKYAKLPSFLLIHILDFYELRDSYISDVDDDSTSSSFSFGGGNRSKLSAELDDRRPLDPFYDFQWMRESFTTSYVKPLLNNHIGVDPSFVVLPELSQIIKMEWFAGNLTFEDAQRTIQKNSFHEQVAHKSEKVLIQRVWSLFAKMKNSCFLYRNQKINLAGLKRQVRLSLRCVALNMLRLRAFSRQFKSSLFDYDVLTSMLQQHADFNQESKSSLLFNPPKHVIDKFRPIKLQERLPQAVYVHYVSFAS